MKTRNNPLWTLVLSSVLISVLSLRRSTSVIKFLGTKSGFQINASNSACVLLILLRQHPLAWSATAGASIFLKAFLILFWALKMALKKFCATWIIRNPAIAGIPFIEHHQLSELSAKLAALIDEFEIPIEEVIKWYPAVTSISTSNCQFEHLFSLFCRLRTIKERGDSYLMAHLGQTVIQISTNRTWCPRGAFGFELVRSFLPNLVNKLNNYSSYEKVLLDVTS